MVEHTKKEELAGTELAQIVEGTLPCSGMFLSFLLSESESESLYCHCTKCNEIGVEALKISAFKTKTK